MNQAHTSDDHYDEFDTLAGERAISPVHQENKPSHKWLIALIAVIVCAPLLGMGIGYGMSMVHTGNTPAASAGDHSEKAKESSKTAEKGADSDKTDKKDSDASQKSDSQSGDADAGEGSADADAQAEDVRLDTAVSVLNGAGIQGFAAENAKKLQDQGFTAVTPGDYSSEDPQQSTVYYRDASLKATAQKVGAILGITAITEDPTSATEQEPIKVVLRS